MKGEGFAFFRWTYLMRDRHAASAPRYYWGMTQRAAAKQRARDAFNDAFERDLRRVSK